MVGIIGTVDAAVLAEVVNGNQEMFAFIGINSLESICSVDMTLGILNIGCTDPQGGVPRPLLIKLQLSK